MHTYALLALVAVAACGSPEIDQANGSVDLLSDYFGAPPTIGRDSTLRAAEGMIVAGRPWKATVLLAPVLSDARRRTPEALLIAARAAAGWSGWTEVDRLLASATWLNDRFDGEGRELLARSALEQNQAQRAVDEGSAALAAARTPEQRAYRTLILARSLDRAQQPDSAAQLYSAAASSIRTVRDWLLLRAAGTIASPGERARLYADVTAPVARTRTGWTEAQALERFGDPAGSAERYAELGDQVASFRLRVVSARDSASRARAKDELLAFIRMRAGSADARQAVSVLDGAYQSLSAREELDVARSVAALVPARAVTGYERADRAGLLSANDRLQFGLALSRAGRAREAMTMLAGVREPAAIAAQAAYQRARLTLTQSGAAAARPALRDVADRYRGEAAMATAALYLLADLYTDDGDDVRARAVYRELYTRYPANGRADDARFHAAVIDMARGERRLAAAGFDSIAALYPNSNELLASRYWAGRAWAALGDTATARARWRAIIAAEPMSYYSVAAARRLGQPGWTAPAATTQEIAAARSPQVDSSFARIALLQRLGMDAEARLELEALDSLVVASGDQDERLAVAQGFLAAGEISRAIRLGIRLLQEGRRDLATYRVAYPVIDREELERASRAHRLDPALVSGLIRQESSFNPRAVSVAGARGLMQVMPSVGEDVARTLSFPVYSPALLFDPDANIQLGTAHLAVSVRRYPDLQRVLAAYNAGQSRVTRWSTKEGVSDPELFTERIPFVETRDYVRIVLRNAEIYRGLYFR